MDQIPGKHRLVFDTTSMDGFRDALVFASNFMLVNRNDYGLQNQDLALIVVARHISTSYGFNNDMWAKYGASLAGQPPSADAPPPQANPSARSMTSLASQGVQFAVCAMATRRLAGTIATICYVLIPINLAFADFTNLEVPTIFWGMVFS